MKRLKANIISLNVGTTQELSGLGKTIKSAFNKEPVDGEVFLSEYNLEGDEQADKRNHGGKDKAVCVYPFDHYPFWEDELGKKLYPGSFGENLTVKGLVENVVHLGDVFKWGESLVQVSQPRMPCHKLGKRHEEETLQQRVIETGFTGFYLRVLKEGAVSETKPLQFVKRYSDVSIAYVNQVFYHERYDEEALNKIINVEELSESWREMLKKEVKL
ncbi:MOSC domain-containing protein [Bacillus alkalicola]|uniref:MOSC domain-containing protein n=2 Tax=Bacillales TaxID=1385 RepID=A0ABS6JWQ5_9BACI|nr:MOSC domain-containing protein [Bacillus alkalicola]